MRAKKARPNRITMPANRFNGFTDYGIGIGLRIPHYAHIFEKKPTVDWFEIISESYMVDGGRPLATLDRILERYRVVQHGVSMYFGSAERLNRCGVSKLWLAALRRPGSPITCVGVALMARIVMISSPCRTPSKLPK